VFKRGAYGGQVNMKRHLFTPVEPAGHRAENKLTTAKSSIIGPCAMSLELLPLVRSGASWPLYVSQRD